MLIKNKQIFIMSSWNFEFIFDYGVHLFKIQLYFCKANITTYITW